MLNIKRQILNLPGHMKSSNLRQMFEDSFIPESGSEKIGIGNSENKQAGKGAGIPSIMPLERPGDGMSLFLTLSFTLKPDSIKTTNRFFWA